MVENKKGLIVAGIGASAGGLEALKQLLPALPDQEDIAYVVVQHLDPKHDSLLASLLSSSTSMKVSEVVHGKALAPNEIYITPPGYDVAINSDKLVLRKNEGSIDPKPSVDRFLTSLAEEKDELAVAIILSGTGSDGALGIRAVKAGGGITIVQDPKTAKYEGMPMAAIKTGGIDLIVKPESIGKELVSIIHSPLLGEKTPVVDATPDDMATLLALLRKHTGNDFSEYKENTIQRRINRRLAVHKLQSLKEYVSFAENNPPDLQGLVKDILISVTEFFRDSGAFERLEKLVPKIIKDKERGQPVRIWAPGCASGEEVYSIAILFAKYLGDAFETARLQFYATDIDAEAVVMARKGFFPEASLVNIEPSIVNRYFKKEHGAFQVVKSIREQIVFAKQDIINDPPFSRLDLIACRNLLIYFKPSLQERLISMFHYALNPGGILFLGESESVGPHTDLFEPISKKWRIFKRLDVGETHPSAFGQKGFFYLGTGDKTLGRAKKPVLSYTDIVNHAVSSAFGPPSVLINDQMRLLHVRGATGKFLRIGEGDAGLNILDLIHKEIRPSLRTAISKAQRDRSPVVSEKNRFSDAEGEIRYVSLHVNPVDLKEIPEGYLLVSFEEELEAETGHYEISDSDDARDRRIVELEHELAATRERLQTTVEELETSNKELQSLNEELQSANEELQSTNEELETSNEELQATNEELTTVNEELQVRTVELSEANSDLENVFKRMSIPLIVVDEELRARRFTPPISSLFNIMPGDREQAVTNLRRHVEIPDFREMLENVLENGKPTDRKVESGATIFELKIYPYLDEDGKIKGALITFYDVTTTHRREQEFKALAENAPDIVARFDRQLRHLYVNRNIEKFVDRSREEFINKTNRELGMPKDLCLTWEKELKKPFDTSKENVFQFELQTSDGVKSFESRVAPEFSSDGKVATVLVVSRDITNIKLADRRLKDTLESISDGFFTLDSDLRLTYFNEAAGRLLGREPSDVLGKKLFESFPEAKGSIFEEKYTQALEDKQKLVFEIYFDAEPYKNWYSVRVFPQRNGISVYFQVTTDQKAAQEELVRQKELLQAIVDNVPALITMYDSNFEMVMVNKEFEEKIGWTREEIETMDIVEKCYPDSEHRARALDYMRKASTDWEEFAITTKTGTTLDMIWSNVRLDDGTQIGIGLDVTEKKKMEEILRQRQKLESLGVLAGGIAHDFNNCLASIMGYAELSYLKSAEKEDCRGDLEEIVEAAKRARELVRRILTFSQKAPFKKGPVRVVKIANEAIRMLRPTIPSSIEIEKRFSDEGMTIMADASQLHQIIMNLCTNAAQAMLEKGGTLRIELEKAESSRFRHQRLAGLKDGDFMRLAVADTGTGISEDALEKLFDPYFTTKKHGQGSGLGLAVVHGIVKSLDGEITVDSTPGKGSEFNVYLPLIKAETRSGEKAGPGESTKGTERILFVDDEPAIAGMQKQILERYGYKVESFTDCLKALETFRDRPDDFDLVATDMTMPKMTGDRFAKEIKKTNPSIPVILCTGHSERIGPSQALDMGIDEFLFKPIEKDEMAVTIRRLLDKAKKPKT